jgi:Raf kinase inhibitor-like YbhB/YbcL family protein
MTSSLSRFKRSTRIKHSTRAGLTAAMLCGGLFGPVTIAHAQEFKLTSTTLGAEFSPDQYWNTFGCTGKNISPDLAWSGAPAGTKSFAITLYDKDAPTGSGFWHWVAYNVPASVSRIEAGALSARKLPAGMVEANTDLGKPGYCTENRQARDSRRRHRRFHRL